MSRLPLGLMLMMTAFVQGCSPASQRPEPLQQGLIYCSEGNPESFNPQLVTSGTTVDATSAQLYDRLLDYDPERQEFLPGLAKTWHALDQGTRYRFELRPNVGFHQTNWFTPTRNFNAKDVIFSFERWLDPTHPYHAIGGGRYPFFSSSGLRSLISKIEQVDDYTVDIHLRRADSSFLANLATDFAIILSAEYGAQLLQQQQPEQIDRQPVGTGPFIFEEFRKDAVVRYRRNQDYWRQAAAIEQLVFSITPNANKRMLKLLTGECDVIPYPLVDELQQLADTSEIKVTSAINPSVAFWAFNTERPPFNQPLVRRALAHAINRSAIIDAIYQGNARTATGMLPETSWAYAAQESGYVYDPELAQELLQQAGFPQGFSMDIWAMPVQRAYNPNAQRMAELIQADLARIGVQANIVSYEWNVFRQRLAQGEHDSVLIGWVADNADPDNFFRPVLSCAAKQSGNNRARWCDPTFDQLLLRAISEDKRSQRTELYRQIEQYVFTQAPLIPIANSLRFQAQRTDVEGLTPPSYGGLDFRQARRLEQEPQQ